jgi:hypothetical protein
MKENEQNCDNDLGGAECESRNRGRGSGLQNLAGSRSAFRTSTCARFIFSVKCFRLTTLCTLRKQNVIPTCSGRQNESNITTSPDPLRFGETSQSPFSFRFALEGFSSMSLGLLVGLWIINCDRKAE